MEMVKSPVLASSQGQAQEVGQEDKNSSDNEPWKVRNDRCGLQSQLRERTGCDG